MTSRASKGWTSPANLALTPQSFRLPQDTVDLLEATAAATGLSKRRAVKQAIEEFAAKRGIEPRKPSRPVYRVPAGRRELGNNILCPPDVK